MLKRLWCYNLFGDIFEMRDVGRAVLNLLV